MPRRRSAAADLRAAALGSKPAPKPHSASPSFITCNGLDLDARRVADTWRQGATGEWASQAAWVSGLASWRLGDWNAASRDLPAGRAARPAARTPRRRLLLGGARRAGCRPSAVGRSLAEGRRKRRSRESFYGLLARETLGHRHEAAGDPFVGFDPPDRPICPTSSARSSWPGSASRRWPRRCFATRPRSALPTEHHALIQLAKRLDLPAAQLWLANNGQWGARSDATDRYPNPHWSPVNGWRVDPALAFGHIVQESAFRRTAVSTRGRGRADAGAADHRPADGAQPRRALHRAPA